MQRTRQVGGRTLLIMAALVIGLTGCSDLSPATITTPYPAADGVGIDLPGTQVALRNFLVVSTAQGAPGAVIGSVVNDGGSPIQVSLQTDLGASTQPTQTLVQVGPHASVQLGPDQTQKMVISALAVPPGAVTEISAATALGGRADVAVPVLLPQGQYATLTPGPTATDTAKPTSSASPTSSN